ncbi:MAG: hypothetical protein A2Y89_03110 [Chloroflexi bacterium RBG_13_51_18]|nr:MAG: hypothetical protein A2Y89_03110 [Chloroflexi bacterium RBG_13_51_18]
MPNLLDLVNIRRSQNLSLVRLEKIKQQGSPYYSYSMPVTAAGASANFDVEHQFPAARKYFPLDWIEVQNADTTIGLTLVINGESSFPVPPNSIRSIDNQAIWHVRLTNNHAANPTVLGNVIATVQRQAETIDSWARKQ